ncbi:hypothetical protein COB21_05895 [Candidatus Aerophobetes bacterium]|uniref:Uncharacterized protein n=1 Tax=Aerophobetes bacterium TaxID=2030807 RepID=A0A2A4WXR7_UNCAE|nr:MAG: hypothetical protein COB21_05895 [Candidatus Aerophobetes bacterium]
MSGLIYLCPWCPLCKEQSRLPNYIGPVLGTYNTQLIQTVAILCRHIIDNVVEHNLRLVEPMTVTKITKISKSVKATREIYQDIINQTWEENKATFVSNNISKNSYWNALVDIPFRVIVVVNKGETVGE